MNQMYTRLFYPLLHRPNRMGNGSSYSSRLSAGMENSRNGHPPDDQEAVQILSGQLGITPRQAEVLH